MNLFGLLPSDLQAKVQPSSDEQSWKIGSGHDLSDAGAQSILDVAADRVLMRLPHRYRQLCRRVDGEILTQRAKGGETTFALGIFPVVAGTLKLWKNFPTSGMWTGRDPRLAMDSGFSVNTSTGLVTLSTALVAGDSLYAEYDHTGASSLLALRDMALTLAAVEVARRFAFFRDGEGFERFDNWERGVYLDLERMTCIDALDRIQLVREDTEPDNFYRRILILRRSDR
jgi:hypothetical protein